MEPRFERVPSHCEGLLSSIHLLATNKCVLLSDWSLSKIKKKEIELEVNRKWSQTSSCRTVDCVWNVMAHAQKPDFVFRRNLRVHLNRRGRQFSRLVAAGVCASAVVMLDTPCSEVVWRVLATHSICHFPLHFPSHASPRAITFQLDSTVRTDAAVVTSQLHAVLRVHFHLFLSDFNRTWICSTEFGKPRNTECYENRSSGSRVVPCLGTDGHAGWS